MPIFTKSIRYTINGNLCTRCKELKLDYPLRKPTNILLKDLKMLAPHSHTIKCFCECDNCKRTYNILLHRISLEEINNNYILCNYCKGKITKSQWTQEKKDEIQEKMRITRTPEKNAIIREKIKQTCLKKFGYETPFHSPEIQNKVKHTLKNKSQEEKINIRKKVRHTLYKNNTGITSQQQEYFGNILKGEINYSLSHLSLDIAFPHEQIEIEYNGGGHDLNVKLKSYTVQEFEQKEIKRNKFIRSQNWKQVFIISPNDKIHNYTEEEYKKIIYIAKQYLLNTTHHWVNIYIEEDKFETSVYTQSITNILNL